MVEIKVGNDVESDHFPLYAKLSFEPEKAAVQKMPPPEEKEMEEAEDQIEKEDEKDKKEKAEGKK